MKIHGALIQEQGITFAIVIVQPYVLRRSSTEIEETRESFQQFFPGALIVLMAQNSSGFPIYHGRKDIVDFLSNIDPLSIPFREYSFA